MASWREFGGMLRSLKHRGHGGAQGNRSVGVSTRILRDGRDRAFGADDQSSAIWVGSYGVEFCAGFFARTDAGWILGRAEIENELWIDEEETDLGLIVVQALAFGILVAAIFISAIIGGGGKVGLGMDLRERPGFA